VLPAKIAGERAIADERKKKNRMIGGGEGKGTDLPSLCIRGVGNPSDDEEVPFTGFVDPSERDKSYISDMVKEFDTPNAGTCLFNFVENVMIGILDPAFTRSKKEHHAMLMSNVI